MTYPEFRELRDRLTSERELLRLDCMNPAKALSRLAPPPSETTATAAEACAAWRERLAPSADPATLLATTGVRPALRAIFAHLAASDPELWLPEDVYPEYLAAAGSAGLRYRTFRTLPRPDWEALASAPPRAALLLPAPLAPLGRYLTEEELQYLSDWRDGGDGRRLILDTVYHFDDRLDRAVLALAEGGRTFVVHSLAKAWLLPDLLGVVLAPPDDVEVLRPLLAEPSPEAAGRAVAALRQRPHLPRDLAAAFRRQWAALGPRLRAAVPDWRPPETGYFGVVPRPFEELLERHQMLTVPASVFGSGRADLSVVSCLYDI